MTNKLQCPNCKGHLVDARSNSMRCMSCGNYEDDLEDYAIATAPFGDYLKDVNERIDKLEAELKGRAVKYIRLQPLYINKKEHYTIK